MFENGVKDFHCSGVLWESPQACGENTHGIVCCDVMVGAVAFAISFPIWGQIICPPRLNESHQLGRILDSQPVSQLARHPSRYSHMYDN